MKSIFSVSLERSEEGSTFTVFIGNNLSLPAINWWKVLRVTAMVTLIGLALLGKVDREFVIRFLETVRNAGK